MNSKLESENNRLKLNIIDLNDSLGVGSFHQANWTEVSRFRGQAQDRAREERRAAARDRPAKRQDGPSTERERPPWSRGATARHN